MLTPDGSPISKGRSTERAPVISAVHGALDAAAMIARPVPKTMSLESQAHKSAAHESAAHEGLEHNAPARVFQQPAPKPAIADIQQSTHQRDLLLLSQSPKDALIVRAAKRSVTLLSDAIVLTLAAPFFALWWIARAIKRRIG